MKPVDWEGSSATTGNGTGRGARSTTSCWRGPRRQGHLTVATQRCTRAPRTIYRIRAFLLGGLPLAGMVMPRARQVTAPPVHLRAVGGGDLEREVRGRSTHWALSGTTKRSSGASRRRSSWSTSQARMGPAVRLLGVERRQAVPHLNDGEASGWFRRIRSYTPPRRRRRLPERGSSCCASAGATTLTARSNGSIARLSDAPVPSKQRTVPISEAMEGHSRKFATKPPKITHLGMHLSLQAVGYFRTWQGAAWSGGGPPAKEARPSLIGIF